MKNKHRAQLGDLIHFDLVPDGVLDRMERDGWVPGDVHRLIASYRQLKERLRKQKANGHKEARDD